MAQLLKKVIKSGFILSYYFIKYCRNDGNIYWLLEREYLLLVI